MFERAPRQRRRAAVPAPAAVRAAGRVRRRVVAVDPTLAATVLAASRPIDMPRDTRIQRSGADTVIRRTLTISPSQLEATKSRTSALSSAFGTVTTFDAVVRALRRCLDGQPNSPELLQALLRSCNEFLDDVGADAETDTNGRKGRRVSLVEDLRAEVKRDLGVLAGQWAYVEAAHAEPDRKHPGRGGLWNQTRESARTGAAKLAAGETDVNGGGVTPAALKEIRMYGLTEAEVLAIRTYTASDFYYINPAMVSYPQVTRRRKGPKTEEQERDAANKDWWDRKRGGQKDTKARRQMRAEGGLHAGVLLQALAKLPAVAATTYRGMDYPANLADEDLVVGQTLRWNSFSSSSTSRSTAVGWAAGTNSVVFKINVTNGRDLRRLSILDGAEGEILLLPGATFDVVSVKIDNKTRPATKTRPAEHWRRFEVILQQTS